MLVRIQPGQVGPALRSISSLARKANPQVPFTYSFVDEEYRRLYKSEQLTGQLANYFAFLGIFISCLGLLGLVAFTAKKRTKEIGIRKVLGHRRPTLP